MIDLNIYLDSLPGEKMIDKMGVTNLNGILLTSMTNSWTKQAYVQVFDCKSTIFLNTFNIFELMDIEESIYEGVVKPSHKNLIEKIPTMLAIAS